MNKNNIIHITTNYDEYKEKINEEINKIMQATNLQKQKIIKNNTNINNNKCIQEVSIKTKIEEDKQKKINEQISNIMQVQQDKEKNKNPKINTIKRKKPNEVVIMKDDKTIDITENKKENKYDFKEIKKNISIINNQNRFIAEYENNLSLITKTTKSNNKIYSKEYLKNLFDPKKINVIVGRAVMKEWTIIYNFYLLERKTFEDKKIFEENNINIIELEKFYENEVFDANTNQEQEEILDKCIKNLLEIIKDINAKIVLYLINSPVYSVLFKKDNINNLRNNVKLVIWRDDLHSFVSNFNIFNLDNTNNISNFKSNILNRANLILSPSVKFFKNINSEYVNKVKYYSYSIDEDLINTFNIPYSNKINNILISGAVNAFVYKKRYTFLNMKQKYPLFTYLMRPPDKHANKKYKNLDESKIKEFGFTGYFKTLSCYKGAVMTLAEKPLDFILGKFIEIFNTNTLAILDYTYELDTRLLLNPFEDYVPLILDKNNLPIIDFNYYNNFINNEYLYNKIVNNGIKVRNYTSLKNNRKILCNIFNDLFLEEKKITGLEYNYIINDGLEYFNIIILGHLEKIIKKLKHNEKINIKTSNILFRKLLNLFFENKINFVIEESNKNIRDFISDNLNKPVLLYDDKYLLDNNITDLECVSKKVNNDSNIICAIIDNNKQLEIIERLRKTDYLKNKEIVLLSLSEIRKNTFIISENQERDIDYLLECNLAFIFDEKYSSLLKNCGVKNILLFNNKNKNIRNCIFNPFETNEINVKIQENQEKLFFNLELEICKITFMFYNLFKLENDSEINFLDMYRNICDILSKNIIIEVIEQVKNYYYYIGEFGFFNMTLLGKLEEYFKNNDKVLYLKTYEDFGRILLNKFGNKVRILSINLVNDREYHDAPTIEIDKEKDINLADLLKINYRAIANITNMQEHLKYSTKELELKHENKEYIAIFPRYRQGRFAWRNIDLEMFNNIINNINKNNNKNLEIIIIGNEKEVLEESKEKYKFYGDILEQIYLLNNHIKLLIGPDSGFIDFAKNSKCKNILLLHKFNIDNYHYKFNPFNINFMTCNYTENCDLSNVLRKVI